MLSAAMLAFAAGTAAGQAMPPDPERPNNSRTCEEAMERVREAQRGSPLVSAERNRELLQEAIKVAERLCAGK